MGPAGSPLRSFARRQRRARLRRALGRFGGNDNKKAVKFQLEIAIRCDFADLFEVKSGGIVRRAVATEWSEPASVSG